ncbi:MAG TPA: hypothetical protein VLC48_06680 [Gemmatimonadota bacterium]|nr:hypothetical protein [Gemmatimonadota bacterium]
MPGREEQAPDLQLDVGRIIETLTALRNRISERFPGSGLGSLCDRFLAIANRSIDRLTWVGTPILPLRIAIAVCVLVLIALPVWLVATAGLPARAPNFFELVQALEAGVNDIIFIGLVLFFLFTLEGRIKRRRALHFLRELRALAHIIDMHQLTKDPDPAIRRLASTPSSPDRDIQQGQLGRYLDYCSEMLSLVSKVAALYAQTFDDPVVLGAVDEVESLTTGLSGKIWQKIMILERNLAVD